MAVTICFHVDRFGRRPLFLISTAGMLVTYMGWTIAAGRDAAADNHNVAAGRAVLAMIFLYYAMYDLAWCGLLVGYTSEILPYNVRAKGLTVMFFSVDLSCEFCCSAVSSCSIADTLHSVLQQLRQPGRSERHWLEVLHCIQ